MAEVNQQQVVDYIKGISVLELSQLVKTLNLSSVCRPQLPCRGACRAVAVVRPRRPVEEKTEFTVVPHRNRRQQINVIKVVREVTSLGLKEAKDLVEARPRRSRKASPRTRPRPSRRSSRTSARRSRSSRSPAPWLCSGHPAPAGHGV